MITVSQTNRYSRRFVILLAVILTIAPVCFAEADDSSHSLCYLASQGRLQALKSRIEREPELLHNQGHGTPLHCAAGGSQADIIDYLVSRGAQLEARDEYGRTPLHWAAHRGEPEAVKRLITLGADVNARDEDGNTPLHRAVKVSRFDWDDNPPSRTERKRRIRTVKLLVDAGSDVNARNDSVGHRDDETPLHLAAESNLPRIIDYLVRQGADVEARNFDGKTPLLTAAGTHYEAFEALETLVRFGADPSARIKQSPSDRPFWNTLSLAARRGHLKTVEFLLELDVPPQYRSGTSEWSALMGAIQNAGSAVGEDNEKQHAAKYLAIIDLLAKDMRGVNEGITGNHRSALDVANEPYVVRHLLEKYPEEFSLQDIGATMEEAIEGLHADSRRDREENKEVFQHLVSALDARLGEEEDRKLDLLVARADPPPNIFQLAMEGELAALKERLARNPKLIETTQYDNTLLHYAAQGGQTEVINYLVEEGLDVNAIGNLGRTPLHAAAVSGEVAAIKSLLDHGAKVDARDKFGYTPLHQAVNVPRANDKPTPPDEQKQRFKAVKLLVAAGAEVDARSDRERTPLHLAATSNLPRAIEYLIEQGAEVDAYSDGMTALHRAAGAPRSAEGLKTLIRLGADPTARRKPPSSPRDIGIDMTYNPLSIAALWGNLEMVKFLLEKDVPTRYGSGESEHSVLYDAMIGASAARREGADKERIDEHLAVVDLLAQEMGGINAGVKHGSFDGTALEAATAPYVARHLLTKYADKFTTEDIETAIEGLAKEIESNSRRIRDEPEKTLEALRSALLIYGIFEAKQGGES